MPTKKVLSILECPLSHKRGIRPPHQRVIPRSLLRKEWGTLVFLLAALSLGENAACIVPIAIAVFPASCQGSGMEVTFQDEDGHPVDKIGMLIVQREYYGFFSGGRISTHVVDIRDSRARIPKQDKLAALWLMPNPFSLYLIPAPVVSPGDTLTIIPLISGYDYHVGFGGTTVYSDCLEVPTVLSYWDAKNGPIRLLGSADHEARALDYYERFLLPWLRREDVARKQDDGPDYPLSTCDYARVITFIEEEIKRLNQRMDARRSRAGPRFPPALDVAM